MADFRILKRVSTLPDPLSADTVYVVRTGEGFDFYISDATGSVAHRVNALQKSGDTGLGGFTAALHDLGNSTGRTITPDLTTSNYQSLTNNGAWTLAAPAAGQYTLLLLVTNHASTAGALTATGFDRVDGDFATGPGLIQLLSITVIGAVRILTVTEAS